MLLVSYGFLLFFLVLAAIYYMVPDRGKKYILLVFSILFYISGGAVYLLYPLVTIGTTFFLGKQIGTMTEKSKIHIKENHLERKEKNEYNKAVKKKQRRLLLCGLLLNFGILAVLKYTNFVLANVAAILQLVGAEGEMEYAGWLLPLGISYYTFQSMGYLIDIYNRKYEPEKSLLDFAQFVLFFPQLVAGPISRFDRMKTELSAARPFNVRNVVFGLERMLWGYFKKLVIADRLACAVSVITSDPETYTGIYFLIGMVFCTVQLYADFSGGMDIVIGAANVLSIRLPENFDHPFFSKNLAELWRRWHMTLMQWFREYIFYPVSGSGFCRKLSGLIKGVFGKKAAGRVPVYTASIAVWFVTGIWHGASWNFVAWGMANCAVLLVSQELSGAYKTFHKRFGFAEAKWYQGFQTVRTFFLFAFLQTFIYYPFPRVFSLAAGLLVNPDFGGLFDGRGASLGLSAPDLALVFAGVLVMSLAALAGKKESVGEQLFRKPFWVQYLAVFFLFVIVLLFGVYGQGYDASQFIYNQF